MYDSVRLPSEFVKIIRSYAKIDQRSVPKQIEHWSKIGKIVEENPDLPYEFIRDTLLGIEDIHAGRISDFKFDRDE